jgi:hypothetical protein
MVCCGNFLKLPEFMMAVRFFLFIPCLFFGGTAECTAADAFKYAGPNIIFGSGSPFEDVDLGTLLSYLCFLFQSLLTEYNNDLEEFVLLLHIIICLMVVFIAFNNLVSVCRKWKSRTCKSSK